MLWLAPSVLFTAGMGLSWQKTNDTFGNGRREMEPFIDARVGYPKDETTTFGFRLRGSHMGINWADTAPLVNDSFDLYTMDVGAFGELSSGNVCAMAWLGMHTALVANESSFTGPVITGGVTFGFNIPNQGGHRITVFGEVIVPRHVFLTDNSVEGDSYDYAPVGLGVAVRF